MNRKKLVFISILLFPLTFIYWLITAIRNMLFNLEILRSSEFDLPVISVGNITVGGTGKTPHIEYLVEMLNNEKYTVAVLSRGYKRKTRHYCEADKDSSVSEIGDEPKQLKNKFPGIIVAVDRKRVHGIQQLLRRNEVPDVVLLDDAFQHRYVKPGKSIVLMDYNRLVIDDFLMPAGRLRESASALKRSDIILITKSPENIKPIEMRNIVKRLNIEMHQHLFFSTINYGNIKPVFDPGKSITLDDLKKEVSSILLLSGIANPEPLRIFARTISDLMVEMSFRDHHAYSLSDLEKINKKFCSIPGENTCILTTEKDAMRLRELPIDEQIRKRLYYVPVKVNFIGNQNVEFDHILLNYVRSNKRNNILYTKVN